MNDKTETLKKLIELAITWADEDNSLMVKNYLYYALELIITLRSELASLTTRLEQLEEVEKAAHVFVKLPRSQFEEINEAVDLLAATLSGGQT